MSMIEICLNPNNETVGEYTDYIVYVYEIVYNIILFAKWKFTLSYFVLVQGGETFKVIEEDHNSTSAVEKQDSDMMALHTAERFIKELRPKTNTTRLRQQVYCPATPY